MLDNTKLFYKLGRIVGSSISKGKWYYQSIFGSEDEAIRAELLVGRELARQVKNQMTIINDQMGQQILDDIGGKLYGKIPNKKREFRFYLVNNKDINAFALPGGLIFLTYPLFNLIHQSPDEVAFVLAHEMMHVVFKHPIKQIFANYSMRFIMTVLTRGGSLGSVAEQMLGSLLKSAYSHESEFEADEYAVRLMYSAGFNPSGSKSLLRTLKKTSNEQLSIYNYFLSHPPIDDRIDKIDSLMKKRGIK